MTTPPYTSYTIHERINRKSYFGTDPYKMHRLLHCIKEPGMFMQPEHLKSESPRRYLNGEAINNNSTIIYYRTTS